MVFVDQFEVIATPHGEYISRFEATKKVVCNAPTPEQLGKCMADYLHTFYHETFQTRPDIYKQRVEKFMNAAIQASGGGSASLPKQNTQPLPSGWVNKGGGFWERTVPDYVLLVQLYGGKYYATLEDKKKHKVYSDATAFDTLSSAIGRATSMFIKHSNEGKPRNAPGFETWVPGMKRREETALQPAHTNKQQLYALYGGLVSYMREYVLENEKEINAELEAYRRKFPTEKMSDFIMNLTRETVSRRTSTVGKNLNYIEEKMKSYPNQPEKWLDRHSLDVLKNSFATMLSAPSPDIARIDLLKRAQEITNEIIAIVDAKEQPAYTPEPEYSEAFRHGRLF